MRFQSTMISKCETKGTFADLQRTFEPSVKDFASILNYHYAEYDFKAWRENGKYYGTLYNRSRDNWTQHEFPDERSARAWCVEQYENIVHMLD